MATYLTTIKFTAQGITKIKDTVARAESVKASAQKHGCKVNEIYWTLGPTDGALVFEAPDDETATAFMLHLSSLGNVQTNTTRVFTIAEMEKIVAKVGK